VSKTIALLVFVGLGVIVGCNDGMASVGYATGPNFIPGEAIARAFSDYGIPGAIKGASVCLFIWFGVTILLDSTNREQSKLPSIIQNAPPLSAEESVKAIETAIRKELRKPAGELNKADFEKVIVMDLQDKGLTSVKGLEKLTQLTDLHLLDNQLNDLKELEKLSKLEVLNLERNQLTSVKSLEKLTRSERLYLNDNQITDVKGLMKLTQLRMLSLNNNPALTKAQITELQKALPNCSITANPKK